MGFETNGKKLHCKSKSKYYFKKYAFREEKRKEKKIQEEDRSSQILQASGK